MRMYDLIEKKKHGIELSADEIREMIALYTKGEIPDYQMSAMTMAIYFRGMSESEVSVLTEAMAASGDTVPTDAFGTRSVDKHSTGGVGDKTTLIVAPTVAAAGGIVAKMSGRGLGHTGGTVDKLESFPGFRTSLTSEEFSAQVKKCGISVIGQSKDLAPADKLLYALRDVTATVDSIPLIASSIMSKKLAAGTNSIVLDVKCGSGAFMNTPELAEELAKTMVKIGKSNGRRTAALITNMDIPLGHAIGNALEVKEAIEVLRGGGPEDLCEVSLSLAALMIQLSLGYSEEQAARVARDTLTSGAAYGKFCEWIAEQGGDASLAKAPEKFGEAKYKEYVYAEEDGYISALNAERIGIAAMMLGAGRATKDDVIDPLAGIVLIRKTSDRVKRGDPIAQLHTNKKETLAEASRIARESISISDTEPPRAKMIYKKVT
ncbi:MAG: thymidine phosphorylase [Clostridia bacterium]|nr:thymidine phosphorylase [Clostridia bacterium]